MQIKLLAFSEFNFKTDVGGPFITLQLQPCQRYLTDLEHGIEKKQCLKWQSKHVSRIMLIRQFSLTSEAELRENTFLHIFGPKKFKLSSILQTF